MTPLETLRRPPSVGKTNAVVAVALAAAAVLALAASSSTIGPAFIPRLTIVNPTVYEVEVDVDDPGRSGVVAFGAVRREKSRTVEELIDQGRRWVFRFSYGGVDAGQLVLSDGDMERAGWRVTIPPEVGHFLEGSGIPPSPP